MAGEINQDMSAEERRRFEERVLHRNKSRDEGGPASEAIESGSRPDPVAIPTVAPNPD